MSDITLTGPIKATDRIESLDVLRGVALLGILLMNIVAMGLPFQAYSNPSAMGGDKGSDFVAWFITETFFEGSMRTMFSALFGAGFLLLIQRLAARYQGLAAADIYYRRMLWLIVFGLVDGYLLMWTGDILYVYGVVGLLLFPIRSLSAKWFLVIAGVLIALNVWSTVHDYGELKESKAAYEATNAGAALAAGEPSVTDEDGDSVEDAVDAAPAGVSGAGADTDELKAKAGEWEKTLFFLQPEADVLAEEIETRNSGYFAQFDEQFEINTEVHADWILFYLLPDQDSLSAMLIGMALLRLGVLTLAAPAMFYWGLVIIGYGVGVPVSLYETLTYAGSGFEPIVAARNWMTYDVGRFAMAAGHAGLVLLICRSGAFSIWRFAMARVGQMALTNYLLHSFLALVIFTGAGFAQFGEVSRATLYLYVVGFWAANIALSIYWLERYRFGPAEWLWRSLTYLTWQPLRRRRAAAAVEAGSPAE